jgi:serine/threonine protein kinase
MNKFVKDRKIGSDTILITPAINENTKINEKYVIKYIDDAIFIQNNELIQKLIRIKHIFATKIYSIVKVRNRFGIITDYVENANDLLNKIVKTENKHLDENTARKIFQQLIMVVRSYHQCGIGELDLKLENILIDQNKNIKTINLGFNHLIKKDNKLMYAVAGLPSYVAPEVINCDSKMNYNKMQVDVWCCGIILFAMLSGRLPFDEPNMKTLITNICKGQYVMSRKISEEAGSLISKMIVVDPNGRYTIDNIINDPWFKEGFDPKLLEVNTMTNNIQNQQSNPSEIPEIEITPQSPIVFSHGDPSMRAFYIHGKNENNSAEIVNTTINSILKNKKNSNIKQNQNQFKGYIHLEKNELFTFAIQIKQIVFDENQMCQVIIKKGIDRSGYLNTFLDEIVSKIDEDIEGVDLGYIDTFFAFS